MSTATAPSTVAGRTGRDAGAEISVLVVFEAGRAAEAALREAAGLAATGAGLWVVTLAPQARPYKCCGGGGPGPYNVGVRGEAEDQLCRARRLLGSVAARSRFTTLVGIPHPPLAAWVTEHAFDLVLLPDHRLARGGGRLARELRRATGAEVRTVR